MLSAFNYSIGKSDANMSPFMFLLSLSCFLLLLIHTKGDLCRIIQLVIFLIAPFGHRSVTAILFAYHLVHALVQMYVHRSGRTARADTDGISIAIISPSDRTKYTTLCRALDKVVICSTLVLVLSSLHLVSSCVLFQHRVFRNFILSYGSITLCAMSMMNMLDLVSVLGLPLLRLCNYRDTELVQDCFDSPCPDSSASSRTVIGSNVNSYVVETRQWLTANLWVT